VRRHGPDLVRAVRALADCPACRGRGVVKGLFHELACDACRSSGFVDAETGQALELDELVFQLGRALRKERALRLAPPAAGPERDYHGDGRRHGVLGNRTGD